jgi:hypothetical protein
MIQARNCNYSNVKGAGDTWKEGLVAVKTISLADIIAKLDTTTQNLFKVNRGDNILEIKCNVKTAATAAALTNIGLDAAAEGTSDGDIEALAINLPLNAIGFYSSKNTTYDGTLTGGGNFVVQGDGWVTVDAEVDESGNSTLVGTLEMYYMPGISK